MAKIIGLFLISTTCLFAQVNTDTIQNSMQPKLDSLSLVLENLKREITTSNHYAEILEKTNQQLSLWYNPYAIFVGAIGVLLTLTTLFFAGYFFLQSRDHKQKINDLIESHKLAFEKLIDDWTERITKIDKQIEENQTKITQTTDKGELEELKLEVDKLKIERESINFPINLGDTPKATYFEWADSDKRKERRKTLYDLLVGTGNSLIKCSKCK